METIDRSHIQERAELLSLCFDTDISLIMSPVFKLNLRIWDGGYIDIVLSGR